LSALDFTYSIASNSCSSILKTNALGVRRTPNQTDSDVTLSRSRDQEKIRKKDCNKIMDV